ncbi:general transcription factor IIF subunit 1 isoform X1 [Octopus sinensis]|uniref:Transcription initiation factor IIF subunit alpha n=1 Tax=Octopus sinensis TaxID=2607531 RepID=A0A6P7T6J2_9MOLL|nr:general transcription factor IIF subunit 1 isoform X1 [Octopus sinensis]
MFVWLNNFFNFNLFCVFVEVLKMASNPVTAGSSTTQEYTVRLPKDRKKRLSMFKFAVGSDLDFSKYTNVRLERENNLREYKTANDIDLMPKFGAGSEFGREQKEEARRKKYGVMLKKYKPEDQPWHMKIGSKQNCKRFKGVREGTISDNTSYFIFTQCADGAFEAFPVEHWYNFNPIIKYKYLNAEEAEEEFKKRDKTLNLFSVMMRKKIRPEDTDLDAEEGEEKKTKTKKQKDFLLTDLDDWAVMSDEDDRDEDDAREDSDNDNKPDKPQKKDAKNVKIKKNSKSNSDNEAIEESDEGDYDDREVDYMTDSASSMSEIEDRDKEEKYEEKGVDEETGLRKLIDSEASSDEEEQKNEDEENEDIKDEKTKKDSDSSSSSSGSDSDMDEKRTSQLLKIKERSKKVLDKKAAPASTASSAAQPEEKKVLPQKRKAEPETSFASKKVRTESPVGNVPCTSSEGISEESIRRYLMRKPMSTKDLLQKFKSKKLNMTNEQLTNCIAQLLRKINPDRLTINKTLHLSLKKPE